MRLNLRIPQNNNLKHDVFEEFLGALHFMTAKFNKPIFFGIENDGQSISFYISSADQISEVIKSQLFAFFPDFQVIDEGESGVLGYHYTITLAGKKHKKIKTYKESEIKVVPSVISELPAHSCFEINVLPVKYDARERLKQNVQKIFASDLER
ncbi:MAG: hypothetical protein U9Q67_01110, partial [Patescibacteria group bacterium]|nr:hypothetical protein [Patescibacteria group bacterium]